MMAARPEEAAVHAELNQQSSSAVVATVADGQREWKISISNPTLNIVEMNGEPNRLLALIDTGSPASFIKRSILSRSNQLVAFEESRCSRRYNTLSNHTIDVLGTIRSNIRLDIRPDLLLEIVFNVHNCDGFEHDAILGRDFLENKLSLSLELDSKEKKGDVLRELNFGEVYSVERIVCGRLRNRFRDDG